MGEKGVRFTPKRKAVSSSLAGGAKKGAVKKQP